MFSSFQYTNHHQNTCFTQQSLKGLSISTLHLLFLLLEYLQIRGCSFWYCLQCLLNPSHFILYLFFFYVLFINRLCAFFVLFCLVFSSHLLYLSFLLTWAEITPDCAQGNHRECWELNVGLLLARQAPYTLYQHSNPQGSHVPYF